MHPILFNIGGITIYSYGFMIAIGAVLGVAYMAMQGKKELKLTFDQANTLFLIIFLAAFIGGKVFMFFEDPSSYASNLSALMTGAGFVFYGSFLFAVPSMLWYFRRQKLPAHQMLDIMAVTTCLVHIFGRIGCFLAGCCYGQSTSMPWGVIFDDEQCQARPLNTSLHPTQLYEAGYILVVLIMLIALRKRKSFQGQLFLLYLSLYGIGRFCLEYFRGDEERGFIVNKYISYAQLTAIFIVLAVFFLWRRWSTQYPVKDTRLVVDIKK